MGSKEGDFVLILVDDGDFNVDMVCFTLLCDHGPGFTIKALTTPVEEQTGFIFVGSHVDFAGDKFSELMLSMVLVKCIYVVCLEGADSHRGIHAYLC